MTLTSPQRWLATAVLMALGYVGTREYVPLFLGVDFIFGSIFAFLALQWLGLGSGLLVALAAGSFTVTHWGHPYAMLTLLAQCAFAGLLVRKQPQRNLPSWVLVFWLTIGLWSVLVSYHYLLGLPWTVSVMVAVKQAVNELFNAFLAGLVFQLYQLRPRAVDNARPKLPIRHLLVNLLAIFSIVPALIVVTVHSREAVRETEAIVQAGIDARQRAIVTEVVSWQAKLRHQFNTVAQKGSRIEASDLKLLATMNPELIFVHLIDASGSIRSSSDTRLSQASTVNYSDRAWFQELIATKQPVVSDVLLGRTSGQVAVALAFPVFSQGQLSGALLTAVSGKTALGHIAPGSSMATDRITLLDRQGIVISSTESAFEPGAAFGPLRGGHIVDREDRFYRLQPERWTSAMQAWLQSYFVVESDRTVLPGWTLVVERPLKSFALNLQRTNLYSLAFVFGLLITAIGLATLAARLIARPFQQLALAMGQFSLQVGRSRANDIARGGIQEIQDLSDGFSKMANEVVSSYDLLKQARDSLELRVAERTAELQLRQQALDAHAIVSMTDQAGRIEYVNDKFVEISGYDRSELLGQDHRLLNSGLHDRHFFQGMWETISQGRVWNGAICNRTKQGDYYWVASTIVPFLDAGGLPSKYISIRTDITAVKENEVELIKAREEAERASNAKSQFLSSMSHELRTPLNAVLGFAQLLNLDESLSDESKEGAQEILKGGEHLLTLINEVLDLAKIESGHMDISLEPVAIGPVVGECRELLERLAIKHKVRLMPGKFDHLAVRADRVRLKQVVLNLASNAIKYNRPGGTVTIEIRQSQPGHLRIAIVDTGFGIAPERLKDLFVPFARLGAENGPIEGTGIGLTITQRLVELMGGKVGVESRQGEGSTFWVDLPEEELHDAHAGADHHANGAADAGARQPSHTVLYIEDNPANLKLVTQILAKREHIHLLTAHTPRLGVDIARTRSPHLILLDINMPEMNGYEVLGILRSDPELASIPVIAITANAAPKDIRKGIEAGFDDYVVKPIDIPKLLAIVDEHLRKQVSL